MAITKRTLKDGSIVYEISFTQRDPSSGKIKRYTERWHPNQNSSDSARKKAARKEEGAFIERCKRGEVLTKKEQKQQQKERAAQEERERLERESKPTYKEYTESYLNRLANVDKCAVGTVSNNTYALNKALPLFGEMKLEDITKAMIRKYMFDIAEQYAHSTAKRYYSMTERMFKTAVEDGVINVSPMDGLKPPKKGKNEPEKKKAFDEDEVRYITSCLNQEPLMWKALITFMIDSGCRRGEAAGLKWESVDIDGGRVTICNNRQYTPGKGVYDTTPKNGKARSFPIGEQAVIMLRAWRAEQRTYCFHRGIPQPEYCFTVNGHAMNPCSMNEHFKSFGEKYGIREFHPHMLRHTSITLSITNGADVRSVSERAGHSGIAQTLNIYSHANEGGMRRAVDTLERAIYGEERQKKAQ